jgi:cation transport ATPase
MLPQRPRLESLPCPACGQVVDAIRAPRVLWLQDGVRFFCGEACQRRFLDGEREFDSPSIPSAPTPEAPRPSIPDLVREATLVREPAEAVGGEHAPGAMSDPRVAIGLGVLALAIAALTPNRAVGWLSAFLIALSASLNARIPVTTIRATPSLRLVAPLGLALAALGSALASEAETRQWWLIGSAIAAIAVSSRNWLHASSWAPVRTLGAELRRTLPSRARVPSEHGSAYEEFSTSALRQGDLCVVLEGESAPADGVVEEGSGIALLYPEAARSKSYSEGDFILAGTRVLEGAITVRVRRTGKERSIMRAVALARRVQQDLGLPSRLRYLLRHWSWAPIAALTAVFLITAGPLAAGTLLLGLPILALVAALDAPLDAGARAAARRGMLFGSSRAVRDASRTDTTAILLRGALTAGEPAVQQVNSLGAMELERVIALAAAAEGAAADHPIARAILRYADAEGIAHVAVRKIRVLTGLGVTATSSHGVPIVVGRRQLLLDEGISVAVADSDAKHVENEGLTAIFVAIDGKLEALISVLDPTHVGAPAAVQRIADLPCEVVILSGDDRRTVERIATHLGAAHVKAPLLPSERAEEVRTLRETGGVTAAIGRGGEDDAVLAAADVPISLRVVGTAIEDRGVVVASRDVRDAASALWIARAVRRSTRRTVGACGAALGVVVLGAWFGWMNPGASAILALALEASALSAGSRLLRRVDLRVPMRH